MSTFHDDLAHELWAIAQSPKPIEEVIPVMVAAMQKNESKAVRIIAQLKQELAQFQEAQAAQDWINNRHRQMES